MRERWDKIWEYCRASCWLWPVYGCMKLVKVLIACGKACVRRHNTKRHEAALSALDMEFKAVVEGINNLPQPQPVAYYANSHAQPWPLQPGAYSRLDYWSPIVSGGSYGHTCYVAKELNNLSPGLSCFMAHPFSLLDEMGVKQTQLKSELEESNEKALLVQGAKYRDILAAQIKALNPSFIYERVCLGTLSAAWAAYICGIPYFAEYNGSEFEMRRSFDTAVMDFEEVFEAVENWSLNQATVISVISEQLKKSLIKRGFDPDKICVIPNAVDTDDYCPLPDGEKKRHRTELGFNDENVVFCFIGTFGGWHGIEVLAAGIPLIVEQVPQARFLLIGDGNYKHLVDKSVADNKLGDKVLCTGNVPQMQGKRLMQAADIYVSPHSSHMKNMPFFGSPTKLFEYMALGGGIVATDLEQIGQVLKPAYMAKEIMQGRAAVDVGNKRAMLCQPGDVDEFVSACVFLARNREICTALGGNARNAAQNEFSWRQHVERLWRFAAGDKSASWEFDQEHAC